MKNTLEKNKRKKLKDSYRNSVRVCILYALLTSVVLFACGCEEPLKKPAAAPPAAAPPAAVKMDGQYPEAIRIILTGLTDKNPIIRVNSIEAVASSGQVRLMPKAQRLLRNEFVPVRFAAALAVGDVQYSLAKKSIMNLLRDRDLNVKIAASYAMIKLGHPEYTKVLYKAITSPDQTVRANAALLLGKTGDKNALNALYWALKQKKSDDKVLFQAADSIAMLGDERIFPKLWAMLISAYADDRVMGIQAMGHLGTLKAKDALITMLDDDVPEVRLAAAEQLGALKDTSGEAVVLEVFEKNLTAGMEKQDIYRIKTRAAMAIGQIRTKSLKKYLPQLLKNESKFVRIAAAKATFQCAMKK